MPSDIIGTDFPDCDGEPLVDKTGACIEVNVKTGIVKIDGMIVFRVVSSDVDGVKVQFADTSKWRSRARGTRYIEIPAAVLFKKLINSCS